MNKILNIITDCLPLFGALFVVTARPAPVNLEQYIYIYLLWFFATLTWSFVCNWIHSLIPSPTDTTYFSLLRVIALLGLVLFIGLLMVLLHYRASVFLSQTILVLLLVLALSYRLQNSQKPMLSTVAICLYQVAACYLSFQMVIVVFDWQSMLFSIGFGLIVSTLRVNSVLPVVSSRLRTLGAVIFGILPLTHALSTPYLLIFGLPVIKHHILPVIAFLGMLTVLAFV